MHVVHHTVCQNKQKRPPPFPIYTTSGQWLLIITSVSRRWPRSVSNLLSFFLLLQVTFKPYSLSGVSLTNKFSVCGGVLGWFGEKRRLRTEDEAGCSRRGISGVCMWGGVRTLLVSGVDVRAVTELGGVLGFPAAEPMCLAPDVLALFTLVFREFGLGVSSRPTGETVPSLWLWGGLISGGSPTCDRVLSLPRPLRHLGGTELLVSNNKLGYLQTVDLLTWVECDVVKLLAGRWFFFFLCPRHLTAVSSSEVNWEHT